MNVAFVPLSYNARSLRARGTSTVLTVLSIAATVTVLAGLLCLQQGFATMFTEHGRTDLAVTESNWHYAGGGCC